MCTAYIIPKTTKIVVILIKIKRSPKSMLAFLVFQKNCVFLLQAYVHMFRYND